MPTFTAFKNKGVDYMDGKAPASPTGPFKARLSTTPPNLAGGNINVPAGGGYVDASFPISALGSAANGVATNTAEIPFTQATASWGTIVAVVILDAADQLLWYVTLGTPQAIPANTTFKIAVGALTNTMTD